MLQKAIETFSSIEAGCVLQQNNNKTPLDVAQLHLRRRFIVRCKLVKGVETFCFYKVIRIIALMGTVNFSRGVTFMEDSLCFNTCHSYTVVRFFFKLRS
jgi:hypothetical protein